MIVELKKTKLIASIMKQSLRATLEDMECSVVLGWVYYRDYKFIVFYDEVSHIVTKFPMWERTELTVKEEGSCPYVLRLVYKSKLIGESGFPISNPASVRSFNAYRVFAHNFSICDGSDSIISKAAKALAAEPGVMLALKINERA